MFLILEERLQSIKGLHKEIDSSLQELELQAIDKGKKEERDRFKAFCKTLQQELSSYQTFLSDFLNQNPQFSFNEYQSSFKDKDENLNKMLIQYIEARTKWI